ncbi:nucleotidyltransferase domain-containing protein [Streptomyces sp. NPDC057620]|uniref:nucleotidyltransferase domain-containing protein n=1 Tax=Streptomyces sp. NPDC057620 TaxID=3346185 RepID=UPI0036A0225C
MLTNKEIDELVARIVARMRPERVIVFGSYAKGTAHPRSDLDLCIITDTELPPGRRADALGPLLGTCLVPVDVHVHTPEEVRVYGAEMYSFLRSVLETGRTVYEARL